MKILAILVSLAACYSALFAADKKPLTNSDVVKMVKAELPESTIIMAIQANPREFDFSVDALIELKSNGVPPEGHGDNVTTGPRFPGFQCSTRSRAEHRGKHAVGGTENAALRLLSRQ